ncbi:hypothetical protein ADN00_13010 [Ornatilinea apprima]|uniref:CRISPR system ring nuclease SSO1393-like domain-containing protein n=1 Tax=Ornatilinea apprima TaxID=1134406 RepID=A0A0P6X2Q6_9CHLR|nr:hypothetical protein [Ornatilinea apprima]KPL75305.1 hypothetical protein ADN00_13010 [Ornatilinea apprima]
MARRFIFTTGTSLLGNFIKKYYDPPNIAEGVFDNRFPREIDILHTPSVRWDGFRAFHYPEMQMDKGIAWNMINTWSTIQARESYQTAEVDSLSFLPVDPENDEVILLASNTPPGLFCALVNANLMTQHGTPVSIWEDVLQEHSQFPIVDWDPENEISWRPIANPLANPAIVLTINQLDPNKKTTFENQALGNLVRSVSLLILHAMDHNMEPHVIFTGGYKATIPFLTLVCSWMGNITMWSLYEDSKEILRIPVPKANLDSRIYRMIAGKLALEMKQDDPYYALFSRWTSKANYTQLSSMDPADQPFFVNHPQPNQPVQLSPMGKAFAEVLRAQLGSAYFKEELKSILSNE